MPKTATSSQDRSQARSEAELLRRSKPETPQIKLAREYCHRVNTYRNIEDWRDIPVEDREGFGPWAVHCLEHDHRAWFGTYHKAKAEVNFPSVCPKCAEFDNACHICEKDRKKWHASGFTEGYTKSVGHIQGQCVCEYHKYGRVPERVWYREVVAKDNRIEIEIYAGEPAPGGYHVAWVEYMTGDHKYWIRPSLTAFAGPMSVEGAVDVREAFGFAVSIAWVLNTALKPVDEFMKYYSPSTFETWEQQAARFAAKQAATQTGEGQ